MDVMHFKDLLICAFFWEVPHLRPTNRIYPLTSGLQGSEFKIMNSRPKPWVNPAGVPRGPPAKGEGDIKNRGGETRNPKLGCLELFAHDESE